MRGEIENTRHTCLSLLNSTAHTQQFSLDHPCHVFDLISGKRPLPKLQHRPVEQFVRRLSQAIVVATATGMVQGGDDVIDASSQQRNSLGCVRFHRRKSRDAICYGYFHRAFSRGLR